MQIKIKNRDVLLSHGDVESRKIVLDITEKTLQHLDAYERIKSIAHMEGDILHIGSRQWDLSKKRNVYLLGAGKACNHMAMAVDEVLGDHLTRGIAIVKIAVIPCPTRKATAPARRSWNWWTMQRQTTSSS